MVVEQVVRAVASRGGGFTRADVERACQASGVRTFGEGDIDEVLRAMEAAGEVVPSGRWLDAKTREPLFRSAGAPARPSAPSREEAEFRAFASAMGVDVEESRSVSVPVTPPRPAGVSEAEEREFKMFERAMGLS